MQCSTSKIVDFRMDWGKPANQIIAQTHIPVHLLSVLLQKIFCNGSLNDVEQDSVCPIPPGNKISNLTGWTAFHHKLAKAILAF